MRSAQAHCVLCGAQRVHSHGGRHHGQGGREDQAESECFGDSFSVRKPRNTVGARGQQAVCCCLHMLTCGRQLPSLVHVYRVLWPTISSSGQAAGYQAAGHVQRCHALQAAVCQYGPKAKLGQPSV